ncbi:MAG TPA: WYL domain-containing protein [Quisquiliibacterium sp.]|nr:WYL domain-containing protein [Quisquiliibacterium sp.]
MNRTERLYRIDQLIHQRGAVTRSELLDELEISWATLKRDMAYLRDRLNAPIVFDHDRGGYAFDRSGAGPQYELPGLWFNAQEIHALLTMHRLLEELDTGGLLGPQIAPLMARLNGMLDSTAGSAQEVMKRVRVIPAQNRPVAAKWFEVVGSALVQRHRLDIAYYTRGRNDRGRREISPQRLVHYRNTWYLDAWCHRTDSLRVFALDAIEDAKMIDRKARNVSQAELDRELGAGYGIYRGKALRWAVLRFSPEAARWVSAETWHPKQEARTLEDGCYELRLPYAGTPELEMDILRHGENVEVVSPEGLRKRIAERHATAAARYAQ